MLELGLYLTLGAFAGLSAGLLGIGGGLIIVPALATLFSYQQIPADIIMHLALGTSLATILVTSISSVRSHHKHRAVIWPHVWRLTPGILAGAWLGGWLAGQMSSDWLKPVFALFEFAVAIHMLSGTQVGSHRNLPGTAGMSTAGTFIGSISAIVGIGGGTLTVPYLIWNSIPLRKAIATSAACGFPIALSGTLAYLVSGWQHPLLPGQAIGYIHVPAFLGIILASALFAPLGARLTHTLPVAALKKIFALFLLAVASKLFFESF